MYASSEGPNRLNQRWLLRIDSISPSVLGTIFSAWSSQTVTHSAHPLHLLGSMMMANRPPGLPCFTAPS